MQYWSGIFTIVLKDIIAEMRAKEAVGAMMVFGLTIMVIFSFALSLDTRDQTEIASGLLWIAFTFSGILGLNHSFSSEYENDCLQGLLLMPVPRSVIYVGKFLSNFLFMLFSEIIILLFFILFFDVSFSGQWLPLALVMILGTLGFSATGTMFSAISSGMRMRVFILPLLQFPMSVPLIIAAVEATSNLLTEGLTVVYGDWIRLLVVYDLIFITASVLLFEYLMEE